MSIEEQADPSAAARILLIRIERFRCFPTCTWHPALGVNVLLGGGDVGKSTILDAVGLLLSPTGFPTITDTDYFDRQVEGGFAIEAVMSLPPASGISQQLRPSWPWLWNGSEAVMPSTDSEGAASQPVYRLRVRGTPELDIVHEILQPDGSTDNLPVGLRRSIGLVRLSGDDRNDRDLRLVQGSALDRLLSDKGLRSRLTNQLAKADVKSELGSEGQKALGELNTSFENASLPSGLDLAVTGGPGASLASMVGLTATTGATAGVQLPLANWGAGTRRLSALAVAEQNQGDAPIMVVDEVERGLEPYRQRILVRRLLAGPSQVFVTTHSASAIAAASSASFWYIDTARRIGPLDVQKIGTHLESDPETFLSRFAIVAEGITELGFSSALLERALGSPLPDHGIHVTDGGGHEATLGLLEALSSAGLRFGGFVDDEGKHPTRWQRLLTAQGQLLFRWASGRLEDNIVNATEDQKLEELVTDPAGEKTGQRLRTLAERLGCVEKDFASLLATAGTGLKSEIIQAALGQVPKGKEAESKRYKSHSQDWFKSEAGGRELARKVFTLGLWQVLKPQLLPFCNAVRATSDLPELTDL